PLIALVLAYGKSALPDTVRERLEYIRRALVDAAEDGLDEFVTAAVSLWNELGLVLARESTLGSLRAPVRGRERLAAQSVVLLGQVPSSDRVPVTVHPPPLLA